MPSGRILEQVVAALEGALATVPGTTIEQRVKVVDRDGVEQEIDVIVTVPTGAERAMRIGFECREYVSNIKKEAIHAFKTKCDEAHINQAVIVTTEGFQKGAVKKAASFGIELWKLGELDKTKFSAISGPPSVSLVLKRFRVVDVGFLIDDSPTSDVSKAIVVDMVRKTRMPFHDWVNHVVNSNPPSFENFKEGAKVCLRIRFSPGQVSVQHEGKEYPLRLLKIEAEYFTETKEGSPVRLGTYGKVGSEPAANISTHKIETDLGDVLVSFVETKDGKLHLLSDWPAECRPASG